MSSTPVFRVTFNRIGRNHCVKPLDARAGTAGDLAQAIYTYARPHLRSREVAVHLDPAEFAAAENGGQGDGLIICGPVHIGGTFTITPHLKGSPQAMTVTATEIGKDPMQLRQGDVITRYPDPAHPDRLGEPGEWRVAWGAARSGDVIHIDYTTPDGSEGTFALDGVSEVRVRASSHEQKKLAVAALVDLLDLGLPEVSVWQIDTHGALHGGLHWRGDRHTALTEWANHLGVGIRYHDYPETPGGQWRADGIYRDVKVHIWYAATTAEVPGQASNPDGAQTSVAERAAEAQS